MDVLTGKRNAIIDRLSDRLCPYPDIYSENVARHTMHYIIKQDKQMTRFACELKYPGPCVRG